MNLGSADHGAILEQVPNTIEESTYLWSTMPSGELNAATVRLETQHQAMPKGPFSALR